VVVKVFRTGQEEISSEAVLVANDEMHDEGSSWIDLDDDLILNLEVREEVVKSWRSHISVIRNEQVVATATIAVNEPFSYGGYAFYQSDADEKRPDYSGLSVVRDPGLGIAYAGMLLVCLGATYTLYLRPWLRKEEAGGKESA
jgi:cytochrome c biogenesis protein ResB